MASALTSREKKILDNLKYAIQTKGYPPTVREMCTSLNIKSTSTAHKDLANLEKKGFIKRDPSKPRAIEILESFDNEAPQSYASDNFINVPVVGTVTAGQPILAQENIESSFPIPIAYVGRGEYFMLKIKGESMIDAGIFDGDLVLVKQQKNAYNGDIVVAMIDSFESEATVKRFFKENNHIRLQPENSSFEPIIVDDVHILGIVTGLFRTM